MELSMFLVCWVHKRPADISLDELLSPKGKLSLNCYLSDLVFLQVFKKDIVFAIFRSLKAS